MPSCKDMELTDTTLKCMVIGKAGTGKSVFASSFPTPGYILDFDKGAILYRGKDFDYDQFPISTAGWAEFEKRLKALEVEVKAGKYKTVIVDSTSTMTDIAMERALALDPKRSATGGPIWNVHYQMVRNLMEGKIQKIINLNCNIVLISHVELTVDQETGAVISADPLLTGQLSIKVPGLFDEVYYATTKVKGGQTEFLLQTVTKGIFNARSRISGKQRILPDFVPNDYAEVIRLAAENKSYSQPVQQVQTPKQNPVTKK